MIKNKKIILPIIIFIVVDLIICLLPLGFIIPIGFDDNKYKYITLILIIIFEILFILKIILKSKKIFYISFIPIFLLLCVYIYYFIISCHIETKQFLQKELGLNPKNLHVESLDYVSLSGSEWVTVSYGSRSVNMKYHIDDINKDVNIYLWYNKGFNSWKYEIYSSDNDEFDSDLFGTKEEYQTNKRIEKNLSNIISKYTNEFKIHSQQEKSYSKYPKYQWNYEVPIYLEDKLKMKDLINDIKEYKNNIYTKYKMNFYFYDKKLYKKHCNENYFDDPKFIYYNFASYKDYDEEAIRNENSYKIDDNEYKLLGIIYHFKVEKQTFATVYEFNAFGETDYSKYLS